MLFKLNWLCILATLLCWLDGCNCQSPCDNDLGTCLQVVRNVAQDSKRFYFGSSYIAKCPPEKAMDVDCFNTFPARNNSIASIIFKPGTFDPMLIDRFFNVTFTSPPGNYSACDHHYWDWNHNTFSLDPASNQTHKPWHVRKQPLMGWREDPNKHYTVLIKDVGAGFLHGVYINIPGNNVEMGKALLPYRGPRNSRNVTHPYVFMLFEQDGEVKLSAEWMSFINDRMSSSNFSVTDFRNQHGLKGPIAMNYLMASFDPYSVERSKLWIENCAPFVEQAFRQLDTPFITEVPKFSVVMRVKFHNQYYDFTYCCTPYMYPERSFFLDPIGNGMKNASETRTGNKVTLHVKMNKHFSNPAVDFKGKMYTILAVDPSLPSYGSLFGTKRYPLVHWIGLNGAVDPTGMISFERELSTWRGPMPPDDKPHNYVFMLFEQKSGMLQLTDTAQYSEAACASSPRAGQCLFMVDSFAKDNSLHLVSASWFLAQNDDFVNMTRGVDEATACGARYPCAMPPVVGGSTTIMASIFTMIFASMLVSLF